MLVSISMFDIVTVVFGEELDVLRLQARSIDLHCQRLNVNKIVVVVNDDEKVNDMIDASWWGSMQDRVRVINRSHWPYTWSQNGWVSQQVLKLLACCESHSDWCMILDAKTIVVQSLSYDDIIDSHGQCQFGTQPVISVFEPAARIASNLFGISVTETAGPAGVPFCMEPNQTRQLFEFVKHNTGTELPDWFQQQGMITEFVLYSAWIIYATGNLSTRYSEKKFVPCNVCHSEVGIFDQKLQQMFGPQVITVSVHRNAWSQLSQPQQQSYTEFLQSRGIQ